MSGLVSFLSELLLPFLVLAALGWLVSQTDRIMARAFPDLEWERNLGWLNIRAERRADRVMRWVGYGIMVLLLDALVGILWAAKDFPPLSNWTDPWVMGELAWRVPALGFCLLIWVIYFGCGLLPRLRAERDAAAFRAFRAQHLAEEEERAEESPSRIHTPLPKPRMHQPPETQGPGRARPRHPPGG